MFVIICLDSVLDTSYSRLLNLDRERIFFTAQLVFSLFSLVTPSLLRKLISCVSWAESKIELDFNEIQY